MDLVTFSALFPNAAQPRHGLFVEARLRELRRHAPVRARVVAPVPWFPFASERFGHYGRLARVPARERRDGVDVAHPRYPLVPKVGMHIAPRAMAWGSRRAVAAAIAAAEASPVLDAHYFYPDGVAAAHLAERFGLPLVITARGSDINLLADFPRVRRRMLWAASRAQRLVAVSAALAARMGEIGMPEARIRVLRNGVDLDTFRVTDRRAAKAATGIDGPLVLSVGNLIELKGHHLVIEALARFPDASLVVAGEGPKLSELQALATRIGVARRVHFVGSVPQTALVEYYNAADMLVLASSREGMANVLLEALACGTPALATAVGGNPEVVAAPEAGRLLAARTAEAIADGMAALWREPIERAATRRYAETFSWRETARELYVQLGEAQAEYGASPSLTS